MQKWLDLLTPSAAALSLILAIALVVQAVRHGRAVRRLESRLAEREGAAARVSLDRLARLQRQARTGSPEIRGAAGLRMPPLRAVGAVILVLPLLAAGGWFLFGRGDNSGSAATTAHSSARAVTAQGIGSTQVPANPPKLPQPKSAYTILVLNGSGVSGAARSIVVPRIQTFGWFTAPPDNAPSSNIKTSYVMQLPGKEAVADNIAKDLGITRKGPLDGYQVPADAGNVDAIVVVGLDLTKRLAP